MLDTHSSRQMSGWQQTDVQHGDVLWLCQSLNSVYRKAAQLPLPECSFVLFWPENDTITTSRSENIGSNGEPGS